MSKIVFKSKTSNGISYLIRYPKRTDLYGLWKYINELSKEKTFISVQDKLTLDQERKWLEKQLDDIKNQKAVYLLVENDRKIIGGSGVNMSEKAIGIHVEIFGISILKDFRHHGIGKVLMSRVLDEAKIKLPQLKILVLGVFSNNPIAKKLYGEFGFKEYGRLPNGIFHRRKYVDDIRMYKAIDDID